MNRIVRISSKDVRDKEGPTHRCFLKVQYLIFQAILSRKSMKKSTVIDEKYTLLQNK